MIGSNTATARVRLALEGQGQVVRGLQEVQTGVGSLRSAFTSIAGGLSLGAAVSQLVQVQREMDVLNASMITVTGSSRAAGMQMEWIKRFAAQTPYQLNEVTGAFVKMKALGLDASEKALRSYGNTASAMGKDLNQFIEAVADAATGEFERLKEFGIKAKKEGDSVALTFQGVTTKVRNNAADITAYLQAIGNNQFAGAMERRVSTLDGAISNLADSWDELARTVNEAGVGNIIETTVRGATAAISGLGATIRENKTELAVLAGGLGGAALAATLPKVGAGLLIVAGGVKALGLALAANPLVLALLGIGAAVGAAAAYSKAQSGTVESMARTVKELEALNARAKAEPWDAVLNANVEKRNQQIADLKKRMAELGQTARDAFALTDPRRTGNVTDEINTIAPASPVSGAAVGATGALSAGAKAATDEFARLRDKLAGEVSDGYAEAQAAAQGLNGAQAEFLKMAGSDQWAKLTNEQRAQVAALYETKIVQEQASSALSDYAKVQEQAARAYADNLSAYQDAARSAQDRVTDMERENEAIELAERLNISLARAVEMTAVARLRERQVAAMGNEAAVMALQAEIDARMRLIDLMGSREAKEAGRKLRENEAAEWARTWDQVGQSFTDALMQGGKSVAEYLKGLFRTLVLRPILAPVGAAFSSLLGSPAAAAGVPAGVAGGSGGVLGSIAQLGGLAGAFGTGMAASFSSMMAAGVSGWATAAGSLIGSGAVSGVAAGLGMIAAPLAVAAALWKPLFGRKAPVTTSQGISGTFSEAGANVQQYQDWFAKGGLFRSDKSGTNYSAVSAEMDSFLDAALAQVASTTRSYAQLMSLNADAINGITQSVKINLQGLNAQQQEQAIADALAGFGSRLAQELLGTFETTVTQRKTFFGRVIETSVTTWVAGPFVRAGETAGEALQRLGMALGVTNQIFDTLGTTLFAASLQGADLASQLVDVFGGLENLQAATAAYYQAFYSDAERLATGTRQMGQALQALGVAVPNSRDGFRSLVEAQDLTTAAGRSTYAALMGLAPAFAELTQAMEQAGSGIAEEVRRLRGLTAAASADEGFASLQGRFATATAAARAGSSTALAELPAISRALEEAAALQATTAAELAVLRGQLAASLSLTMSGMGLQVPAFDVGTNYVPRDMFARIHEGEAIVPKAYNPAAGGVSPGSDAMAAELRALRQEVALLRAESGAGLGAVAMHTAKSARILERAQPTGDALLTMTQAEFAAL